MVHETPSNNRGGTTGGTITSQRNFLLLESDYIGDISYDIDVPISLADYKHLNYPLAPDVFCGYRPTTLELQSALHLVSAQDYGPYPDLLNPVSSYPVNSTTPLSPEDAALLVGLIPGIERQLQGRTGFTGDTSDLIQSGIHKEKSELHDVANLEKQDPIDSVAELKDPIDVLIDSFGNYRQKIFVHPQKPHLKPINVLPVLPHRTLWENSYIQAALQEVNYSHSSGHSITNPEFLLKSIEKVSQRLQGFALFSSRVEPSSKVLEKDLKKDETTFYFVKDFIARVRFVIVFRKYHVTYQFPDNSYSHSHLLFDFPTNLSNKNKSDLVSGPNYPGAVYVMPLKSSKILFTKSTQGDAKRARLPIRLSIRESIPEEEIIEEGYGLQPLRSISSSTELLNCSINKLSSIASSFEYETINKIPVTQELNNNLKKEVSTSYLTAAVDSTSRLSSGPSNKSGLSEQSSIDTPDNALLSSDSDCQE